MRLLEISRFLHRFEYIYTVYIYFDTLQEHTKEVLDSWKIVRVSEDFRVIALGLPVPKYKGNPLDPPLRSRFQARNISYLPFKVCTHYLFLKKPHRHSHISVTSI